MLLSKSSVCDSKISRFKNKKKNLVDYLVAEK